MRERDIDRLFEAQRLRFEFTLLTNKSPTSRKIIAISRAPDDRTQSREELPLAWPPDVYSLTHVALPFSPDDPLYGSHPDDPDGLHIGSLDSRGERGVLSLPASELLRLRHNPFYSFMEERVEAFLGL